MFKKTPLSLAVVALLVLPVAAMAEIEVSGYVKNETAFHIQDGQRTGQATTTLDTASDDVGDVMKFENSARFFVNGDIGEESSFHADINLIHDSKGVNSDYKGHRNFTQNDWIRELYLDTSASSWDFRIGKQQEVWGTADGIKLLDIINPTDFREMNQSTMEDARIPVFMIKGESDVGESGNVQLVLSQSKPNVVAGLNVSDGATRTTGATSGTDTGHPFILKGVDTITGGVNGFFNIGAAMGGVTSTFFGGGFTDPDDNGFAEITTVGAYTGSTVEFDTSNPANPLNCSGQATGGTTPINVSGANCLSQFTQITNQFATNLIDTSPVVDGLGNVLDTTGAGWDTNNPDSTWEYMPNATFATFNTYVGMSTRYERDYVDDTKANLGMRYRGSMDNGLNFGINYLYSYDPNPVVNIHWENSSGGTLTANEYTTNAGTTVVQLSNQAGTEFYGANDIIYNDVGGGSAEYVGSAPVDVTSGNYGGAPILVFEEKLTRAHNIGTSFDYAIDTTSVPLVLRGEFLYQKDIHQPIVDIAALGRGNLTAALTTQESDFFKYVIGLDATVLTNLMVSGQFIQFRNLDFVDGTDRYTADPATMHLTNGLQKGWENKEFYSLFFSKPFGESQLGRWNNITIYEEGGGWWNRFDVEYSFSDQLVGTAELNTYWGDENTTFGQFEESSNIQVGVKYLFD
ncbi:MAG: RNA polymerase-associated protein rapA [Sedimenticola sp.]